MADHIPDLIRNIIAGGESFYAEFKSAYEFGMDGKRPRDIKEIRRDIGEAVVAFSNSDGGDLLVGVEDTGRITGVPFDEDRTEFIAQAARALVDGEPIVTVHLAEIDGFRVLLFRVQESVGEPLVTVSGRCLWRKGASSQPIPPRQIERRRKNLQGDRRYESEPVPMAKISDLNLAYLERPMANLRISDPLDLLQYWNLLEVRNGSVVLRQAALLLFAKEPLRWHPNNRVRLRRVHGESEGFGRHLNTRETEIVGPIVKLLEEGISWLQRGLKSESRIDTLFSTTQLLPTEAVEECVVNAVVHRNYAIEGQAIEIFLYPDRVEYKSPGGLPEPLTIEDLRQQRGVHRSRNPLIMRVLRDFGWTRDMGEGIRRIFGAMSQVELHEPTIEELGDSFVVRLSTRSLYDNATQAWIASYGPFGLEPSERKFLVALRRNGGKLSVDKLARKLGQSFDETKSPLVTLERKGFVWHPSRSRTFHLVQPLNVPHERAYRLLRSAGVSIEGGVEIDRDKIALIAGTSDSTSVKSFTQEWRETGILKPSGKGTWKLGDAFMAYAKERR